MGQLLHYYAQNSIFNQIYGSYPNREDHNKHLQRTKEEVLNLLTRMLSVSQPMPSHQTATSVSLLKTCQTVFRRGLIYQALNILQVPTKEPVSKLALFEFVHSFSLTTFLYNNLIKNKKKIENTFPLYKTERMYFQSIK